MNTNDPSLTTGGNVNEHNPEEAAAPVTEAVNTPAPAPEAPAPQAEAEAEFMVSDAVEAAEDDAAEPRELTPEALIAEAVELYGRDAADISGDDIRRLRSLYLAMRRRDAAAVADADTQAETVAEPDPADAEFDKLIENIKTKKAAWVAEQEALRAENLRRKNEIIDQINALAEDTDNVNRTFPRYRELQEEFNAIGDVDPTEETAVWKRFQDAREKYSDNLKINKELRDYDFKKNLTDKEALLAEARALVEVEDVVVAYRRLQELHNRWRQIGPVAKELREEIWAHFREASAEVNKRYQAFFEARKAREMEYEAAKTALCEQIEALDYQSLKTFAAWEEMTQVIVDLQAQWRKLGFASKKANHVLFARFRHVCDAFFEAKAEFFRTVREQLGANLALKQQLVAEAEQLKDSTDWRAATDRFVAMQAQWKSIGAIPKKFSESLWNRFTAACDYFFDQKKKAGSGARATEQANLRAKREIIGLLSAMVDEAPDKETAAEQLRQLQDRWKEIGHVPFREKDRVYEAYRAAVDAVRRQFALAESRARRQRFEANVAAIEGDGDKLYRERERLARALENRRNDLRTYENNLGFLSTKSKNGDSLLRDLERRIDHIKNDINELVEKITMLDEKIAGQKQ